MEIKLKKDKIIVTHTLRKGQNFKFQKGESIQSFMVFNKPQIVSGFSNVCEDGMQILIIDYDNINIEIIYEDWYYLKNKFYLSDAYVFKTTKGYHVICLSKFKPAEIPEILSYTRCDQNYKDMPLRNPFRSYVLRISAKKNGKRPKYVKTLIGNSIKGQISSAHKRLLKRLYPQMIFYNHTPQDHLRKIKLNIYETK